MKTSLERTLQRHPYPYVTNTEIKVLLNSTVDSRYSKVKRLLEQGQLLHIRRGLYCLTERAGYTRKPHSFELADHIYGPSYISLESALSFHQLIPEAVYTTTSVTIKRSKEFHTPLGVFSYLRLPAIDFFTEVELVKENDYQFFIAKPWKAICDYVFCYKKDWHSLEPLSKSLRLDCDNLPILRDEDIQLFDDYYHHKRLSRFLKGIKTELSDR